MGTVGVLPIATVPTTAAIVCRWHQAAFLRRRGFCAAAAVAAT